MKLIYRSRILVAIFAMSAIFMIPTSAKAANPSYTLNVNYDSNSCTATINGAKGIINSNVTEGDNVGITFNNQSAVTLNVIFAFTGGTGSYYETIFPSGAT